MKTVLFVTGEVSGDLHAGNVALKMKKNMPDLNMFAMGGKYLKKAGCKIIFSIEKIGVVGFVEVLFKYFLIRKAMNLVFDFILKKKPDLVVLTDYPGFNLRLAKKIKKRVSSVKIVYYISPQLWAWNYNRIKLIKKYVDYVVVILPFEKKIYDKEKIPCRYFGHPLAEIVKPDLKLQDKYNKTILFMPGSRTHEIKSHLPFMKRLALSLKKLDNNFRFLLSVADSVDIKLFEGIKKSDLFSIVRNAPFHKASFVVAASGTATLEATLAMKPCVVLYKLNFISWILFKILAKTEFISLTNIILRKRVLPEFIGPVLNIKRVLNEILLLMDEKRKDNFIVESKRLRSLLFKRNSWENTAKFFLRLIYGS